MKSWHAACNDISERAFKKRRRLRCGAVAAASGLYRPGDRENGRGAVIHKFMPIGEVYRLYFLLQNGSVYLDDDPWLGFGPERPAYQTVYMDDDELCQFKHDWLKTTVTIEFNPSAARVRLANQRQRYR